ncbi:MAG: L-serine ammonia-lyase, iron-sulfur-dependent subunit beta [Lachnospiraceae bacterium]|nr:L-serine ammonia-lyase, iron-sulfur-dependent subunit beta [Lachnospiraceae bacterium]
MNIFDIIGPVMIGPSSSHTAGACRIGYIARRLLTSDPKNATITFAGSFAKTYHGHGTDKAVVAGILGMQPDDLRLPDAPQIAKEQGLSYTIETADLPKSHPNTAVIRLTGTDGTEVEIEGASVGGGNILISKLNGMTSAFTGENNTVIVAHTDAPGVIADVASAFAMFDINIGSFRLARPHKGQQAIMTLEIDGEATPQILELLKRQANVTQVVYLKAH